MFTWHLLVSLLLHSVNIYSQSYSIYPCIWQDKITNARLDLQLFKNTTLNAENGNITIYYTPCANGLDINGKHTMIYIENTATNTKQELAEWDNGVLTPNHTYNQWYFQYTSNQIKCVGSSETQINITWQCVGGSVLTPYIFEINYDTNNLCKVEVTIFSAVACLDGTSADCSFYDVNNNKLDLSVYNDSVIQTKITYPSSNPNNFMYSPCIPSLTCNNYMVLASEVTKSGECNHSLALYTPYMNSLYGNIGFDNINQVWSLQYFSGDKCDNGNINRLFDVAWQCDTTIYPTMYLVNNDSSEITECIDQLTINSSFACLNFIPCIYNDTKNGATLNLTHIFPILLDTQYDNMKDIYLLYSPCQLALNAINSTQSSSINNLYNAGNAIIGEYTKSEGNGGYDPTGVYSKDYMIEPIYNEDDKSWQFVYNDDSMSYKFIVTWQCDSSTDISLYAIKSPDLSQLIVYSKDVC